MLHKEEVRAYYKPYYDKSDEAHQIDHADSVYDLAVRFNTELKLGIDNDELLLACYIHDIFTGPNREAHHTLAYEYVLKNLHDKFLSDLTIESRTNIAYAVKEHRASVVVKKYHSKLAECLASADKGILNLNDMIIRSYRYNTSKGNNTQRIMNIHYHMKDKFGSDGYVIYPKMYYKLFKSDIKALEKSVDKLTIEDVYKIVEEYRT